MQFIQQRTQFGEPYDARHDQELVDPTFARDIRSARRTDTTDCAARPALALPGRDVHVLGCMPSSRVP